MAFGFTPDFSTSTTDYNYNYHDSSYSNSRNKFDSELSIIESILILVNLFNGLITLCSLSEVFIQTSFVILIPILISYLITWSPMLLLFSLITTDNHPYKIKEFLTDNNQKIIGLIISCISFISTSIFTLALYDCPIQPLIGLLGFTIPNSAIAMSLISLATSIVFITATSCVFIGIKKAIDFILKCLFNKDLSKEPDIIEETSLPSASSLVSLIDLQKSSTTPLALQHTSANSYNAESTESPPTISYSIK